MDVKQLIRPSFVEPKRVSAPAVKAGRVAAGVNGAEYRIHLGCDGIFDKPIIIAEGYDVSQNVNLDDLTARYFDELQLYRNNGYDLVLVNYDNGRTWIQNNAQVLKAVINQVNATKVGNNKLIIIGESMSGLVARYALKQMENDGQNHNVSHFVAFDTPMKGANVPPGFIELRRWASSTDIVGIAELLDDCFGSFPVLRTLDEPAAKQMLLTQLGSTPAPEFFQFQTEINNLGYPSQNGIKNIAIVNGALNGTPQRRFNAQFNSNGTYSEIDQGPLNDGDRIFDFSIWAILDMVAWTHRTNVQDSYIAFGNEPLAIFEPAVRFYLTSSINRDLHPGGRIVSTEGSVYTSFSFVPTFSSIDYRGALNNNNDYYLNIRNFVNGGNNQVTNATLTPFAAIYGNDVNNFHAKPNFERDAFRDFGVRELNMVENGCIGCTAGSGGLAGTYFGNEELGGQFPNTTTTAEVNYYLDQGRPIILGSFTNGSARWEGSIQAPISGNYTFNMRSDDGCRVWFDGTQRVDDWGYYAAKDHPFQVNLNAGERKNIKIEWKQGGGGYVAELYWELNGVPSIIPKCFLFPTAAPTTTDCDFTLSATSNPSTTTCGGTSSLTASCTGSGCSGVSYAWSGNSSNYSGSSVTMTLPSSNGTVGYTLTASKSGCANKTATTNVNVSGCNGDVTNCTYTEGQFLFTWNGENIYAHKCGAKNYVTTSSGSGGGFKPRHWLEATNYAQASCFEEDDPRPSGCDGSGCSSPTPSLSASSPNVPSALNANGCNGTVNWSNGSTGSSINVTVASTYTATCTNAGCSASGNGSITIGNGNNGGSCSYSEGQFLFNWYGENVYAHKCEAKNYVTTSSGSDGGFKPRHWLEATNYAQANCFEEDDPRPSGCGGGGGNTSTCSNISTVNCGNATEGYTHTINVAQTGNYKFKITYASGDSNPTGTIIVDSDPAIQFSVGSSTGSWNPSVEVLVGSVQKTLSAGNHNVRITGVNGVSGSTFAHNKLCAVSASSNRIATIFEEVEESLTVYPNPTNGKIKVSFTLQKDENVWFNLYDSQGKNLQLSDYEGKKGRNVVEFDLQDYPTGAYFIDLQYNQKREIRKVIKVN